MTETEHILPLDRQREEQEKGRREGEEVARLGQSAQRFMVSASKVSNFRSQLTTSFNGFYIIRRKGKGSGRGWLERGVLAPDNFLYSM